MRRHGEGTKAAGSPLATVTAVVVAGAVPAAVVGGVVDRGRGRRHRSRRSHHRRERDAERLADGVQLTRDRHPVDITAAGVRDHRRR